VRALAAPALFLAAGLPFTAALARTRGRLALRLGWAYALGLAWMGAALYALSHAANLPLRKGPIALVALAPAIILGLHRLLLGSARAPSARAPRLPFPRVALATALLGAIVCLAALAETITNPFGGWDDRAIWVAHARHIRAAGSVDAPAFRDARIAIEVPRHPALLPVLQTAVLELFSTDDERAARTLYAWVLPAFLLILFGESRARAGTLAAAAGASAAALLPMLTFEGDGGAVSGYSDLPLGLFWGGAVLLLTGRPRGRGAAALASLLLAAAVFSKNEGLPLAATTVLVLAALSSRALLRTARRKQGRRVLIGAAWPALAIVLAVGLLASWRAGIPMRLEPNFDPSLGPKTVLAGLVRRYPLLFVQMLKQMQRPERWGLFFFVAPVVFFIGRRAMRRGASLRLALAFLAALGCYGLAYAATRLNPFSLVIVTWNRFLVQLSLVLLVLFALALREAWARPRLGFGLVPVAALCLFTPLTARVRWPYNDVGLGPTRETALSPEQLVWPDPKSVPPALRTQRGDLAIPAAIDEPAEGAVVHGTLRVRGWAQEGGGERAEVLAIELDGRRRALASFARTPRPDVARALPRLGNCERAGFEAILAPAPEDAGMRDAAPHELVVRCLAGERMRALTRRFVWKP
jgi:hypothetical protein